MFLTQSLLNYRKCDHIYALLYCYSMLGMDYIMITYIEMCEIISGSSHSDKEVDALTPEKSAAMRGSVAGPGVALVPPSGATPTVAMPERKRKRKGLFIYLDIIYKLCVLFVSASGLNCWSDFMHTKSLPYQGIKSMDLHLRRQGVYQLSDV